MIADLRGGGKGSRCRSNACNYLSWTSDGKVPGFLFCLVFVLSLSVPELSICLPVSGDRKSLGALVLDDSSFGNIYLCNSSPVTI